MTAAKTCTLTLRIEPALKEALRVAAEGEHRSIANMIEVFIRNHCTRTGIRMPDTCAHVTDAAAGGSGRSKSRRTRA